MIMKIKRTLFVAAIALLSLSHVGWAFEVDFSKNGVTDLFEVTEKKQPEVIEGQMVLPAEIETKALPIEPGKKYKLEISVRVDSDFVVEENDRAHIRMLKNHQYRLTSAYRVVFQNAEGENVRFLGSTSGFFLSKKLRPYTFVFTAPEGAAALKVNLRANNRKAYLAGLRLVEETEEKTVNPNPDFRYGDLSYSGWRPAREGRLYTRPDGKTVLHVGYSGTSPYFPLDPAKKYRITAVGEGGTMTLHYYNKDGKSLLSRAFGTVTLKGMEKEVQPPAGAVAGRVSMLGSLILEEFKVVEIK